MEAARSRGEKDPFRPLTDAEQHTLSQLSRSQAARSPILAVAAGNEDRQAARSAGRRSGDADSHLVARFNLQGLSALSPRHGGGQHRLYDQAARQRILREVGRKSTPGADGTSSWSLSTLEKSLRSDPDGLPRVATSAIWQVLQEPSRGHQRSRTWCPTGSALRKRKSGMAVVTDPEAESEKSRSTRRRRRSNGWAS